MELHKPIKIGRIIVNPDPKMVRSHGTLAHVEESERKEIMGAAFGQFKPLVKRLEKEVKAALKAYEEAQRIAREREARQAQPVEKPRGYYKPRR